MKDTTIYIISLFFGFLITILLILYYSEIKNMIMYRKSPDNNDNDIERFEEFEDYNEEKQLNILKYDDIKEKDNNDYIIYGGNFNDKYKIDSFINNPALISLISSYESNNIQENLEGLKWKLDNNSKYINDIIVSKYPAKNRYILNPNVYGYNLRDISIEFINNYNSSINNIGFLFTLKFNDIISTNLLNINENTISTISINIINKEKKKEYQVSSHAVPINIVNNYGIIDIEEDYDLNYKKMYDIELVVNNNKYIVNDISEDILRDSVIFLGLIINSNSIYFYINDKIYDFKRSDNSNNIVIKYPFFINKNKDCDFMLYSNALVINDINIKNTIKNYNLYNNYNLHSKMNI